MKLSTRDRIWLLALAVVVLGAAGNRVVGQDAPDALKVGVMNLSRVFGEAKEMEKLKAEINLLYGARISALTKNREQLRADATEMAKAPDADEGEKRALLQRLNRVQEQIEKVNRDVDQRKLAFLKGFEGRLRAAADAACEELGVDLLLSRADLDLDAAGSAGALAAALSGRSIWHSSGRVLDVTDDVLRRLDEE